MLEFGEFAYLQRVVLDLVNDAFPTWRLWSAVQVKVFLVYFWLQQLLGATYMGAV